MGRVGREGQEDTKDEEDEWIGGKGIEDKGMDDKGIAASRDNASNQDKPGTKLRAGSLSPP